jgi:hypothetical protein
MKKEIKVAKWGTPKKYLKKQNNSILLTAICYPANNQEKKSKLHCGF